MCQVCCGILGGRPEVASLATYFSYDPITEFFYSGEDVGDRGEVLDLRVTHADLDRVIVTERMLLLTKFDDLLGQEDGIDFFFRCFHVENGVMECWSIGVMGVKYYTP